MDRFFLQILAVVMLVACSGEAQQNSAVLDSIPQFPISVSRVPLRRALSEIDSHLLEPDYAIFGLELAPSEIPEPLVDLKTSGGVTVREAIAQIMAHAPGYGYSAVGPHLIDIYPISWRNDPRNLLNMEVAKIDLKDQDVEDLLHAPWLFIPPLRERLTRRVEPGQPAGFAGELMRAARSPKLSLRMENATLREVLDKAAEIMSEAPPPWSHVGWVYEFRAEETDPAPAKHVDRSTQRKGA